MAIELRKTRISVVGDVPWGTHFCYFYETTQDLLDTLVPYFKAGLESNEFCLWVVSNSLLITVEEAKGALQQAVPDLDRHLSDEHIEILNGLDWYLEKDVFNLEKVTNAWDAKLKRALALGYDGIRISGDALWLGEKYWKDFCAYEKQLNDSITDRPMTVLCTYPLAKSGAAEVLDVVQIHQFAIARRQGEWEVIETPELKQTKAEIIRLNEALEQRVAERTNELRVANEELRKEITERKQIERQLRESQQQYESLVHSTDGIVWEVDAATFRFTFVSKQAERILGYPSAQWLEPTFWADHLHPADRDWAVGFCVDATQRRVDHQFEYRMIAADGRVVWLRDHTTVNVRMDQSVRLHGVMFDITERKGVEALLHAKEQEFRAIVENAPDQIIRYDREFRRTYVNPAVAKAYGLPAEALTGTPVGSVIQDAGLDVKEDELAQIRQRIASVFETGEPYEHELTWSMPTRRKYYSVRLFPERDLNGSVINVLGISRDITERKEAEEKLRQSESQLAEAQRLASIGSWNWDIQDNTQTWSDELYHMYGLHPQECEPSYETFLELVHPDDRAVISGVVEHALKTLGTINSYLRIIRPDGAERILHSRWNTISDISGTPIRMHGTLQDVTERKQVEDALHEAERKYRDIFENAAEGIFQTTPDGRFVAANPALARMLGFDSPEELMSTRTDIAQEHYVDPQIRDEFKRSMEENGFVRDLEFEAYRKDGSKIWVSENVRTVRDHSGTIVYYEGTTQDITGRKQAEEALNESEERYRDLIENSRDLICTHDLDGSILSANRAAIEIMGFSSDSYLSGTNLCEILAPEVRDKFDEYLKRIRADGVASGLMLVQTRTGEKRIWEYHNTLRTQGVSAPIVRGMARDITERRQADHSLRLFRTLIDRSTDAIEVIDPDTLRFLNCNKSAYQDLGYSREEFLSLSVYDIDPLVDERMAARLIEEVDRSGFVLFESVHRRKDGSTFPVEVNLKTVRLEKDYTLAVVRDITERKRAEEKLKQSESQLAEAQRLAHVGYWERNIDSGEIIWSDETYRIFGLQPQEPLENFEELIHPEDRPVQVEATARTLRGEHYDVEYRVVRPDGEVRLVHSQGDAIRDESGRPRRAFGTVQDVTQLKRAEEKLKATSEQLRALSARVQSAREEEGTRIAREIHDELGAALSSLRWDLEGVDEAISESVNGSQLQELRQKIEAMMALTDTTINVVRRISSELRPIALDDLGLTEAIEWQARQFQDRTGIIVQCDCTLESVDLSREQSTAVFRIFQEALTNILRHAQATQVNIQMKEEDGEFILTVTDNGRGITVDEKSGQRTLGLLGMRERGHLIGAKIDVTGSDGKGTVVTVRIPISD